MKLKKAPNLNFPLTFKSESCSDELFDDFNNGKEVEISSFEDLIELPNGKAIYVIDIYGED
mgnify:CR=1 FL=1